MPELSFQVQGSDPDPYEVTFLQKDEQLIALCTCTAGQNGQHCKHRTEILKGKTKAVVSDNTAEVETLKAWLVGTKLETALKRVAEAESLKDKELKKDALSTAKKALARAMRG